MPIKIEGKVIDVETYTGKNGFGANVTLSRKIGKKTKTIHFATKDEKMAFNLEERLDEDVMVEIELSESKFGLRLGQIFEILEVA